MADFGTKIGQYAHASSHSVYRSTDRPAISIYRIDCTWLSMKAQVGTWLKAADAPNNKRQECAT